VVALHDTLEEGLLELGCYRREDRQFTPHVTLGRVKKEENTQPLAALLAKKSVFQAGSTTITSVQVMSSQLTPDGPIYSVLSRARLAQ
jgi:2'-5' RNA ligase